jgi:hypothetical protein
MLCFELRLCLDRRRGVGSGRPGLAKPDGQVIGWCDTGQYGPRLVQLLGTQRAGGRADCRRIVQAFTLPPGPERIAEHEHEMREQRSE